MGPQCCYGPIQPGSQESIAIVVKLYYAQLNTFTDGKGHVKGEKHKTEWVTCVTN